MFSMFLLFYDLLVLVWLVFSLVFMLFLVFIEIVYCCRASSLICFGVFVGGD